MSLEYEVIITEEAISDLRRCIEYIVDVLKSDQAASSVIDDYIETISILRIVAGSLKICDSKEMKSRRLRHINFRKHNYFMLFLIVRGFS